MTHTVAPRPSSFTFHVSRFTPLSPDWAEAVAEQAQVVAILVLRLVALVVQHLDRGREAAYRAPADRAAAGEALGGGRGEAALVELLRGRAVRAEGDRVE